MDTFDAIIVLLMGICCIRFVMQRSHGDRAQREVDQNRKGLQIERLKKTNGGFYA